MLFSFEPLSEGAAYCNAQCQKKHWKTHRPNCSRVSVQVQKQLDEMNATLDDGASCPVAERESESSSLPAPGNIGDNSGLGSIAVVWNPGFTSCVHKRPMSIAETLRGPQRRPMNSVGDGIVEFNDLTDLPPTLRFLLCCSLLPQLDVAKACVSEAIQLCNGDIGKVRAPNLEFTALEWAAKRGNTEIVKWLCTDERTKPLVDIGCPIGWASYAGNVEVMQLLVRYGADPRKSDRYCFDYLPPLMLAGMGGQLEALKFFVNDCKQDIRMVDGRGWNVLKHTMGTPNWQDSPGHVAVLNWARPLIEGRT
eukprot:scaffold16700_cov119-Cylindrotheca_fusiformis.AAC.1